MSFLQGQIVVWFGIKQFIQDGDQMHVGIVRTENFVLKLNESTIQTEKII